MAGPNLFDFATSELSQDAFLCWLVAQAGQDERADLRDLGRAFIGLLWSKARGEPVASERVRLTTRPVKQFKHIDILFEAEIAGRPATFLIEDKTDTTHHHNQLKRYQDELRRRAREVVCIYFKTGYHFGEDVRAAEHGYVVIGLKEWVTFLNEHSIDHDVFDDYRRYVARILAERETRLAALLTPAGHETLCEDYAQFEFIQSLASRCPETIDGSAIHRGANMGGSPWTQLRFASFGRVLPGGIGEVLFYRVDARNDAEGVRRYYLSTRQYAAVKGDGEARKVKLRRLQEHRTAFDRAVRESGSGLTFSRPAGDKKGANESEVGILFFDGGANTVPTVLDRLPMLHRAFVARLKEDEAKG